MKKNYITPSSLTILLSADEQLCATSTLTTDGGDNINIAPSEEEYNGEFHSASRGWNSADWTQE